MNIYRAVKPIVDFPPFALPLRPLSAGLFFGLKTNLFLIARLTKIIRREFMADREFAARCVLFCVNNFYVITGSVACYVYARNYL